jgi:hypothetical protein
MAKLRINDIPASAGQGRRVEVTWEDGRTAPRVAVAEFDDAPDEGDGERIRWYLEDYAEFPADPAPLLARAAEARLAQAGEDLFRPRRAEARLRRSGSRDRDVLDDADLVTLGVEDDQGDRVGAGGIECPYCHSGTHRL